MNDPVMQLTEPVALDEGPFDEQEFPLLAAVSRGAHGEALKRELQRWAARYFAPRAKRLVTRVLAKLVRVVDGQRLVDTVLIRDISSSGLQAAIHRSVPLSLPRMASVEFLLSTGRGAGRREFAVTATFVRVVNLGDEFAILGFRFKEMSADKALDLAALSHNLSLSAIKAVPRSPSTAPLPK